jgi:transposase
LKDIALLTNLDWKTIKDIDINYIEEKIVAFKPLKPTQIGVDEIAYEKGHKYLTIGRNSLLNKVIWIGMD